MKELIIEVATLCPNRCVHCSSGCGYVANVNIPFEKYALLLSVASKHGFRRVVFSGGEPMAFPLLPLFISYAQANNFSTKIYTSGSGDKDVIASLFDFEKKILPDIIVFSCYGNTPAMNGKITGNLNFFTNLRNMLMLVQRFSIHSELNFVPMKINFYNLEDTFFMFFDFIESFNVIRLVMQGNAIKNWKNIYIHDNELQPILNKLKQFTKLNIGRSFKLDSLQSFKACEAGSKKICISNDGYILPCEVFKQDRFAFMNINNLNETELFALFDKLVSININSYSKSGCLKKDVQKQLLSA